MTEFDEFKDISINKKVARNKMKRISKKVKNIKLVKNQIKKISLSCFDDKRFLLDHVIHTLVYFHKDLKKTLFTQMIIDFHR